MRTPTAVAQLKGQTGFRRVSTQQQEAVGFQSLGAGGGIALVLPVACMRKVRGT